MTVKTNLEMSKDISKPEQLITEHIDIWTSAILAKSTSGRGSSKKYELYGIKKLRKLILELAIRGKLVPQDANDEPASVLLEKIAIERAQLIKEGKIREAKPVAKIKREEDFLELPNNWELCRFGAITFNLDPERVPLSVEVRRNRQGSYDYYGASGVIDKIDDYLFEKPLLLIGEDGANLINRSTPIAFIARGKYWVNNHAHVIDGINEEFLLYLCIHINAISLEAYITGSAQPKMNQAKMNSILIALPPLEEQKRIIAKVDELMMLCDQLEQQTEASIEAHATLVEVLLATMTDSTDSDELAQNWARISEHFDSLFTTEQSIEALKQTVLQLAVMGKLVPQDPNDEPASVLLKKIAKEKEQLIKDKVIKKEKPLSAITDEEKPFKLQTGWVWGRINDIAHLKGGFAYKSKEFLDVGTYQVVRMGNIRPDNLRLDKNSVYIPEDLAESTQDYRINTGDILLTMTGTNGKEDYLYSLVVLDTHLLDQQLYLNQRLCRLRPILMNVDFLNIALKEPQLKNPIFNQSTGSANQANIGMGVISHWVLPVPPLAEQHRIVTKVDELMAICDQLKQKLKQSQETQVQLTDALIDRTLG